MKYSILKFPHEALSKKSEPVIVFDAQLHELLDDMIVLMKDNKGLGLAAPQVGVNKRIFVAYNYNGHRNKDPEVVEFINPEIIEESQEKVYLDEGCLSLPPDLFVKIPRPKEVMMKAKNRNGEEFVVVALDLEAVVLKHELQHLDGEFFVDALPRQQRRLIAKKAKL